VATPWRCSLAGEVARWLMPSQVMLLPAALVPLLDAVLDPRAGRLAALLVHRLLANNADH
jgi:hypothetical protein